jgi:RecA/RadA recombinase
MMSKEINKETGKDKLKALEMAISQIEKSFGKGAIMRLGGAEHFIVSKFSIGKDRRF